MAENENLPTANAPRRLNLEEIDNPYLVITEFFTFNGLPECREELRNWFYAALADESFAYSVQ